MRLLLVLFFFRQAAFQKFQNPIWSRWRLFTEELMLDKTFSRQCDFFSLCVSFPFRKSSKHRQWHDLQFQLFDISIFHLLHLNAHHPKIDDKMRGTIEKTSSNTFQVE